jgi:hypothetical protein
MMMMMDRTDGTLSEHQNILFAMLLPAFRSSVSTNKALEVQCGQDAQCH